MIYKTQVFTEQQLKNLPKGLKAVTTEPVKKGEVTEKELPHQEVHPEGIYKIDERHKEGIWNIEVIIKLGEVVQAVNEKGEEQWYNEHLIYSTCTTGQDLKPLLVRLEKTEKDKEPLNEILTKFQDVWLKTWEMKKWKS